MQQNKIKQVIIGEKVGKSLIENKKKKKQIN